MKGWLVFLAIVGLLLVCGLVPVVGRVVAWLIAAGIVFGLPGYGVWWLSRRFTVVRRA